MSAEPSCVVRRGSREDRGILEDMLFEAFHWNPEAPRPERAAFEASDEFRKLLDAWGERDGDRCVVAENAGRPVGAAWYRFWTPDVHSYGFVEAAIPEIAIGVREGHRSQGVGRAMLRALVEVARSEMLGALSLSVSPENFALHLYESLGFRKVGEEGTSHTLVLRLEGSSGEELDVADSAVSTPDPGGAGFGEA